MAENGLQKVTGDLVVGSQAGVNPAAVYLATLAPTGRRSMRAALDVVARLAGYDDAWAMPWCELRYEHVEALKARLAETYKPATVNKHLAAIRGVVRAAWHTGQLDSDSYNRIVAVKGVTGSGLPRGRAIGAGELAAMMRACVEDTSDAGTRDAAIVALGYAAGLRRAELAGLTLASLEYDDGETVTIRLTGKRSKERLAYVDNGAAKALRAWVAVRGGDSGPLFYAGRRGGHLVAGQGMTAQAVFDVILRRAEQAGVSAVTPHDLRRSFVSDLLDAGVDIATVAAMAGHSSVTTTARYDRRGEQAKKRGARTLHVPFGPAK